MAWVNIPALVNLLDVGGICNGAIAGRGEAATVVAIDKDSFDGCLLDPMECQGGAILH